MLMNPFLNSMMHPLLAAAATQEAVAAAVAAASFMQHPDINPSIADDLNTKKHKINSILPLIKTEYNQTKPQKNDIESKGQQVMCNLCSKMFYNEEYLILHKLNKHGVKPTSHAGDAQQVNSPRTSRASTKLAEQTANNKENDASLHTQAENQTINEQKIALTNSTTKNTNKYDAYSETYCEYCNKKFCKVFMNRD